MDMLHELKDLKAELAQVRVDLQATQTQVEEHAKVQAFWRDVAEANFSTVKLQCNEEITNFRRALEKHVEVVLDRQSKLSGEIFKEQVDQAEEQHKQAEASQRIQIQLQDQRLLVLEQLVDKIAKRTFSENDLDSVEIPAHQEATVSGQNVVTDPAPTEQTGTRHEDAMNEDQKTNGQSSTQIGIEGGNTIPQSAKETLQAQYVFEESVYDAMFFIFTENIRKRDSVLVCVGFLINLAVQTGVVIVLRNHFTKDRLPTEKMIKLKDWRASEGHSYRNADPLTGVSLVARVCAEDASLSVASYQMQLADDAFDYFGDRSPSDGEILCFIAILLWILICALELRKSVQFVMGLLHCRFYLFTLSSSRLLVGCIVALCRCMIAALLLGFGSWWLAYTTSIEDLLLNASALGFVLDIDDIIFQVLSSSYYQSVVSGADPLLLPNLERHVPIALAIGIAAYAVFVDSQLAGHTREQLRLVVEILCSESTDIDFVSGMTQAGWLVYAESVPYDDSTSAVVTSKRAAVQYLIDQLPEADIYADNVSIGYRDQNLGLVQRASVMLFEEQVSRRICEDFNDPKLGGRLWVATGVAAVRGVSFCAQVRSYCIGGSQFADDSTLVKNVRYMCPVTCGCEDPLSGFWHLASPALGCPWWDCKMKMSSKLKAQGDHRYICEDRSIVALEHNSIWSLMLSRMRFSSMIDDAVFDNMSRLGCPAIQSLPYLNRTLVCGLYDLFSRDISFVGAGVMCPESCGCIYPYSMEGPEVPPGYVQYNPGEDALCPMASCAEAYAADANIFFCENYGLCDGDGAN